MTYSKLVTSLIVVSVISMMSFVIKTQYDTISEQKRAIATYQPMLEIEGIGAEADGQIKQIERIEHEENNESNNSNDDSIYVDFDRLFTSS